MSEITPATFRAEIEKIRKQEPWKDPEWQRRQGLIPIEDTTFADEVDGTGHFGPVRHYDDIDYPEDPIEDDGAWLGIVLLLTAMAIGIGIGLAIGALM